MSIQAYAAPRAGAPLERIEYDPGALGAHEVEIDVDYCGICHSDLSMIENDWEMSDYPMIPGHEVAGTVAATGEHVTHLTEGQTVGLGWLKSSCTHCEECRAGDHNLCGEALSTIDGRGGFAEKVRAGAEWAVPIPADLDAEKVGPLFCGGITVFNPLVEFDVTPTERTGVVGIGGLGHLALQFLDRWGCGVTAFTSSPGKAEEARALGADRVIDSRSPAEIEAEADSLDLVLVTANADLDWDAYLDTLRPKGRLHFVGAVPDPVPVEAFRLIENQLAVSGSPIGSPTMIAEMLEFCARHEIEPVTELFPLSEVNEALDHLRSGQTRYRIVLETGR